MINTVMTQFAKLLSITIIAFMSALAANAQVAVIQIQDAGMVALNCGDEYLLSDGDTTPGVQYNPNLNDSITICADGVNGAYVSFFADTLSASTIDANMDWNLGSSDTLFIYDGNSLGAPLLGAYTSPVDSNVNVLASYQNTSGCLTFQFVTDGTGESDGFAGILGCGFTCQPFTPIIGSNPPNDSGYIDICLGDTVWFDAQALFPYSTSSGGIGYNQTIANSTIDWSVSDGSSFPDAESVMFVPTQRTGYNVDMFITDTLGCPVATRVKVRVSSTPVFSEMAMALADTVCINLPGILLGGVDPNDTTSVGVAATETSFFAGGSFSVFTYLPDGGNVTYETNIGIAQFPPGQTIQNASDIVDMCITMEHSWLGDLEMVLTCPNGTELTIFNSSTDIEGLVPGGFGGGGIYLGSPLDDPATQPGSGWQYCFSDQAVWGTFEQEFDAGNFTPSGTPISNSMSEGAYKPEDSFSAFIGCPINGDWIITVKDNQLADDGYIFEWEINFNPDISPAIEYYTPTLVDGFWGPDPTITALLGDTAIEVTQSSPGTFGYQFFVEDDFGCVYDTTVNIVVIPPNELLAAPQTCIDGQTFLEVINSREGGEWSSNQTTVSFIPDEFALDTEVEVTEEGVYWFSFFDTYCQVSDSIQVVVANTPNVTVFSDTNRICDALTLDVNANAGTSIFDGGSEIMWSPSGAAAEQFTVEASNPLHYVMTDPADSTQVSVTATASNYCGTSSADLPFQIIPCLVVTPTIFNPESNVPENAFFNVTSLELHIGNNVKIFDRWGRKCYDVDDYHLNPWRGDGANDGVYYWVLVREGYEAETGYVHLVHGSN